MTLLSSSSIVMNIPRRGRFVLSNLYPKPLPTNNVSLTGRDSMRRNIHSNTVTFENAHPQAFFVPAPAPSLQSLQLHNITKNVNIHNLIQHFIPGAMGMTFSNQLEELWNDLSTWFIKRTYQPSVIRKRRKTGFLSRQKSVGGRRILKRRRAKGRMRLGGC